MKKTTKKTERTMRIVNLIDVQDADDIQWRFTYAKVANGESITIKEFSDYGEAVMSATIDTFVSIHNSYVQSELEALNCECDSCKVSEKKPWYKRIFGWFARKK